ncbi:hypothetical protein LEP1GSC127_4735 [Leptospira kirschneri str. 200801925]|nr:hypothetical protein LEP1GSC127_4735 [Leptospira kirschneri str. 200801925]
MKKLENFYKVLLCFPVFVFKLPARTTIPQKQSTLIFIFKRSHIRIGKR